MCEDHSPEDSGLVRASPLDRTTSQHSQKETVANMQTA